MYFPQIPSYIPPSLSDVFQSPDPNFLSVCRPQNLRSGVFGDLSPVKVCRGNDLVGSGQESQGNEMSEYIRNFKHKSTCHRQRISDILEPGVDIVEKDSELKK